MAAYKRKPEIVEAWRVPLDLQDTRWMETWPDWVRQAFVYGRIFGTPFPDTEGLLVACPGDRPAVAPPGHWIVADSSFRFHHDVTPNGLTKLHYLKVVSATEFEKRYEPIGTAPQEQ